MLGLKIIPSSEGTLRQIPFDDKKRAHPKQISKKITPKPCLYFKRGAKNIPIAGSL